MPTTNTSPNMNIVVPVPLTDTGPDWAQRLYTAFFATVDAHDHSSGKGVQITPAGMNISADLQLNSHNTLSARSHQLANNGAPLSLGGDVLCVYASNSELWYNDSFGRQVQITKVGAVNTAPQVLSVKSVTTSYTILSTDTFQLFSCVTGAGAVAIALPSVATVAAGRVYYILDRDGSAAVNNITLTPNGTDTIDGLNSPLIVPGNYSMTILTTTLAGAWTAETIQAAPVYGASLVGISTGTTTLTAAQLRAGVIQFSGTLTGAVTIVVPNGIASYVMDFSAVVMGANTIAIKSGTTTSATMAAANIGSTAPTNQLSFVYTYGGNTVRIKA